MKLDKPVSLTCIDKRFLEFGMWNQQYQGKDYKYVYSVLPRKGEFTFTGVTKTNVKTGQGLTYNELHGVNGLQPLGPKV